MRYGFLVCLTFAALIAAAPVSLAFEIQHTTTNPDGSAKLVDPDAVTNGTSARFSGQDGSGGVLHFGDTTLQINGGNGGWNNAYGMSPAYREQFMGGPDQIGRAVSPR